MLKSMFLGLSVMVLDVINRIFDISKDGKILFSCPPLCNIWRCSPNKEVLVCPYCETENPADVTYCKECGRRLRK